MLPSILSLTKGRLKIDCQGDHVTSMSYGYFQLKTYNFLRGGLKKGSLVTLALKGRR